MKIFGLMCVRDEADLLLEVFPHIKSLVDELLVYEDGSQDNTYEQIKTASYVMRCEDDKERLDIARPNYHHLLEHIKRNYDFNVDPIWVVIAMGDRFFLNKTPKEIVESAEENGATSVEGVQLDFLRCRSNPWTEEIDTFPNYPDSLRRLCRWTRIAERCIVAYKVSEELSYRRAKYPWPKGLTTPQFSKRIYEEKLSVDMPFLEHQGRRSPNAARWRYTTGSRDVSIKYDWDFSTFHTALNTMETFYNAYQLIPWFGLHTLDDIVNFYKSDDCTDKPRRRAFFRGLEHMFVEGMNRKMPEREDL